MTVAVDVEITALMQCLQRQRNHVLRAVEGLRDAALRRPVLSSGWSCPGMVQHLTPSVERLWFRAVVTGDPQATDMVGSQHRLHNLRDVLLHVITETACHAGHLDTARGLIDGQQWSVNT